MIENTGVFAGYFAQDQQTAEGLTENIFKKLNACVGFVPIMHERGWVTQLDGGQIQRASVFIEQEIAIIAFLMTTRPEVPIEVAAYIHQGIKREGIRDKILLNPIVFTSDTEVLADFAKKVSQWAERYSQAFGRSISPP